MTIILSVCKQLLGEKLDECTMSSIDKTMSIETRRFLDPPWMLCRWETFVVIENRRKKRTVETFASGTWILEADHESFAL